MDPRRRPKLTLRERDRRWAAVRDLLRRRGLDVLVVGSFRSRELYDGYLTNDHLDGIVVFPVAGEPTALTWNGTHLSRANVSVGRGEDVWIADCRLGFSGARTADVFAEKGLTAGRIGVVGLSATSAGEPEGTLPQAFWANLSTALPNACFEDVSRAYGDLLLVKSEEERALVRYAAEVSEAACRRMLEACRPGAGEDEIYAEVMHEIFRRGCDARYPMMSLQSGHSNIGWGRPRWIVRAEAPRRLQPGDMVQAEIHTCYGGQEAQVQMSVAIEPIDEVNRRCAEVARQSYEAGVAAIRPGVTVADILSVMEEPLRAAGCWAKTPLVHTMNFGAAGGTGVGRDLIAGTAEGRIEATDGYARRRLDLALAPGMLLELEPNASIGMCRVNIGGPVFVTESGCEELNELPTRVRHAS